MSKQRKSSGRRLERKSAFSPENAEFAALLRKSGWNQSEAARQLEVTSNHVNMIIKGRTKPSKSLLKLLRLLIVRKSQPDPPVTLIVERLESIAEPIRSHLVFFFLQILREYVGNLDLSREFLIKDQGKSVSQPPKTS